MASAPPRGAIFCNACGAANAPEAQLCLNCGHVVKRLEYHPKIVHGPQGFGGWLAVFCLATCIVAPVVFAKNYLHPHTSFSWLAAGSAVPVLLGVVAGVMVMIEASDALAFVKGFFIALVVKASFWLWVWIADGFKDQEYLRISLRTMIGLLVWFVYFRKSVRVRNTFGNL